MIKLRKWLIVSCVFLLLSVATAILFSVWAANEKKQQWETLFDTTFEEAGRLKTYKNLQYLIESGDFEQAKELVDLLVWAQDYKVGSLLTRERVPEHNKTKLRESLEYQAVAKSKPNKPLN